MPLIRPIAQCQKCGHQVRPQTRRTRRKCPVCGTSHGVFVFLPKKACPICGFKGWILVAREDSAPF